jgi:hypothetical protein
VIAPSAAPDAGHYTVHYELLRAEVLGVGRDAMQPDAVGRPRLVGLAIMLREGMPGWLDALKAVIRPSLAPSPSDAAQWPARQSPGSDASVPAWLFGVPRHDLAALLASLVLSTRRVDYSSPTEDVCHVTEQ